MAHHDKQDKQEKAAQAHQPKGATPPTQDKMGQKMTASFFNIKEDGQVEWLGAKEASQLQNFKADGVVFNRAAHSPQDKEEHQQYLNAIKDSPRKTVLDNVQAANDEEMKRTVQERVRSQKAAGGAHQGAASQGTQGQQDQQKQAVTAPPSGPAAVPTSGNPPPSADQPPMGEGQTANTTGPLGAGGQMVSGQERASEGGEPMPGQDAMGHLADGTPTTTNLNANNPPGIANPENLTNASVTQPQPGQEPLLSHNGQPLQNPNR